MSEQIHTLAGKQYRLLVGGDSRGCTDCAFHAPGEWGECKRPGGYLACRTVRYAFPYNHLPGYYHYQLVVPYEEDL